MTGRGGIAVSRRAFGAGVFGALLTPGCLPKEPLRITAHPWPGYDLTKLGIADARAKRHDVRWTAVDTVQQSFERLSSGEADGACLTLDQMLVARSQGIPLRAYLIFDVSAGADTVLARPDLRGLEDLRGAKVGVESSSLGAIMLSKLLDAASLARADVAVVPMDENHDIAWERNDLDFIITYEPSLGRLRRVGLKPVFDSRQLPKLIVDLLAVRPDAAAARGEAMMWIIETHFLMLEALRTNPVDLHSRLSAMTTMPPDEVAASFRGLDFPDPLYNRRLLTPPATELNRVAEELQGLLVENGVISGPLDLNELFSPRYLPRFGL